MIPSQPLKFYCDFLSLTSLSRECLDTGCISNCNCQEIMRALLTMTNSIRLPWSIKFLNTGVFNCIWKKQHITNQLWCFMNTLVLNDFRSKLCYQKLTETTIYGRKTTFLIIVFCFSWFKELFSASICLDIPITMKNCLCQVCTKIITNFKVILWLKNLKFSVLVKVLVFLFQTIFIQFYT